LFREERVESSSDSIQKWSDALILVVLLFLKPSESDSWAPVCCYWVGVRRVFHLFCFTLTLAFLGQFVVPFVPGSSVPQLSLNQTRIVRLTVFDLVALPVLSFQSNFIVCSANIPKVLRSSSRPLKVV
jgi:hypothetical protein